MQLKDYQSALLEALEAFLGRSPEVGPAVAYAEVTALTEIKARLGRYAKPYRAPEALGDTPYVCLRLPTGGGKTLMAAHSVRAVRDAGLAGERPVVLWLVTSNIIRSQTVAALSDPRHPYRQALDEAFGGRVRVFDIGDFNQVRPHDLDQNVCVIVGTVQTLKVENTEGRKVYAHHEDLEAHFRRIPARELDAVAGLERTAAGQVKYSFANLMHLMRPAMIVDEAHNVVTNLSDEMRRRVNPSCVIEFTATPKGRSNILFNATAAELKAEQMIKLPIVLQEHTAWQAAVAATVVERAGLASMAASERDYIRPIALYQAEPRDREVTVEVLKRHLIEIEGVPESAIAVATGEERGLEGVDLAARDCPIEHVITVQALKEGWDCPFAYVFCSVASLRSDTAVEQLLGRVLRMPYAERRRNPLLNKAYAHVSEPNFAEAAKRLRDALIDTMGFEDGEAADAIEQAELDIGMFAIKEDGRAFQMEAPDTPEVRTVLAAAGVPVRVGPEGGLVLTREIMARPGVAEGVFRAAPERAPVLRARLKEIGAAPASQGEVLRVPALFAEVQGELVFADADLLLEHFEWRLSDEPPEAPGLKEALKETVTRFEIDLHGQQVLSKVLAREDDLFAGEDGGGNWTVDRLAVQLDRAIPATDLDQPDKVGWLVAVIRRLMDDGFTGPQLARLKHGLVRRLRARIDELRVAHRKAVVQRCLFDVGSPLRAVASEAFVFRAGMYADRKRYVGRHAFSKHFLEFVPAFDGKTDDAEEVRCALALDALPEVKHWVRNVAQHPSSFWLQMSKDRTYPDFVAELEGGRILVVEYKGADRWKDAEEARAIGRVWEQAGGGLYLMARLKDEQGRDPFMQMAAKVRGGD